jgi:phage repressor protein C with HTH and peptisase S24 domain
MLKHDDIWRAIDTLASRNGLTASGLARKAGLDPTTFNKSKRVTASGRRRWPSTESLAKALEAVGASLNEFVAFVEAESGNDNGVGDQARRIPVAAQSAAAATTAFGATGEPQGPAWNRRQLPEINDPDAYAIVVESTAHHPVWREGTLVIAAPQARTSPGDRVVVRMKSADIVLAELVRQGPEGIDIKPLFGDDATRTIAKDEIAAVHRIVWAEQ